MATELPDINDMRPEETHLPLKGICHSSRQ